MSFENLRKKDDVQEEGDVIYSSVFETDVYTFTVDMAYVDKTEKGAGFLFLSLLADDGRTLSQNIYFTSGDDKGNAITYPVKKNGKPTGEKKYLPGFELANSIHELLTEGTELADMETEGKLVKVWDRESSSEKPMEKEVLVDLLGKKIKLAVQKQAMFKTVNKDGKYVETSEVVNRNEIVKAFDHETDQTLKEIKAEADAAYMEKWIAAYQNKTFDKTKAKEKKESGGKEGSASKTAGKKKLFG